MEGAKRQRIRSEESKQKDQALKKVKREDTRDLLTQLAQLVRIYQEQNGQPCKKIKVELNAILSEIIKLVKDRIVDGDPHFPKSPESSQPCGARAVRSLAAQSPCPAPPGTAPHVLSEGIYRAMVMNSSSVGALLMGLDDWVVMESSSAMDRYCPLDLIRGYTGHELVTFVHPDQHLELLQLQKHLLASWSSHKPPSQQWTQRFRPQRVQLLRADRDICTGVMVGEYVWQTLQVVDVVMDRQGRKFVLFVCVFDERDLVPLRFDAEDRRRVLESRAHVSGTWTIDAAKSSYGNVVSLTKTLNEVLNWSSEVDDSNAAFARGLFGFMGNTLSWESLHSWLASFVSSSLGGVVKCHVILDMISGVPIFQQSVGLFAFGMSSGFRTVRTVELNGMFQDVGVRGGPHSCVTGYLKSRPSEEGQEKFGMIVLGIYDGSDNLDQMHAPKGTVRVNRSIFGIGLHEFPAFPACSPWSSSWDSAFPNPQHHNVHSSQPCKPVCSDSHVFFLQDGAEGEVAIRRFSTTLTRTGDVDPEVYQRFLNKEYEDIVTLPISIGRKPRQQ